MLYGHTLLSKAFANDFKVGKIAMDIALYHHEKWDGNGYPQGLIKENIPIAARIVAIVDVFDALMNSRVYKNAWTLEDTLKVIAEGSDVHFEPRLVKLFLLNIECFMNVLSKYRSDSDERTDCKIILQK